MALVSMGVASCVVSSVAMGPVGLPSKTVSTVAGQAGVMGSADGTGTGATLSFPAGMVIIGSTLYFCDSNNSTIRQMSLTTGAVTTIPSVAGVAGYFDNAGTSVPYAYFNHPEGITTDGASLFVADSGNNVIRVLTKPGAVWLASTVATGLNNPLGICWVAGAPNMLYIADSGNCTIDKVAATGGTVTILAGQQLVAGSADGTGSSAIFTYPQGIVSDGGPTNLYVVDTGNDTVRLVTTAGVVTTIAGQLGVKGDVDGAGLTAEFNWPEGIAIDNTNTNLYIADTLNAVIRQITISSGSVTTLAGQGQLTGSGDGAGNVATFNHPMRLVYYPTTPGLYVADTYNETIRLIK